MRAKAHFIFMPCQLSSARLKTAPCVHAYDIFCYYLQAPQEEAFDWARQWYPLAFVEDLDPRRPHAVELLGKRLVLWRDAQKQWRAFEDRCPHRLALLSGTPPMVSYCCFEVILAPEATGD